MRDEFPRSSYKLITKAGKYGKTPEDHRYDKKTIRESVQKSLERFKTDYLDVVCEPTVPIGPFFHPLKTLADLHDVESISSVLCPAGKPLEALNDLKADSSSDPYKLRPPHRPLGAGDEQILEGLRELRALQKEGKILHIGIAAYPLPIILRIALLAKADPSVGPLDIIQTYTHQTIQNAALEGGYLQAFDDAGVKQVMNASPLAMGLLTSVGPPEWHQAIMQKTDLAPVSREASELCKQRGTTLEEIAAKFGSRKLIQPNGNRVPVVIGCKNVDEVKRAVATWRAVNVNGVDKKTQEDFKAVMELFESRGVKGYSYRSL